MFKTSCIKLDKLLSKLRSISPSLYLTSKFGVIVKYLLVPLILIINLLSFSPALLKLESSITNVLNSFFLPLVASRLAEKVILKLPLNLAT